jgi:endonuclease/exonuclease/phosphatase family metal-dependent hydrolase
MTISKGNELRAMKIMSYNIHHGVGEDGILNLEIVGKVINTSGASIIGLQEVDNHWSERSDFKDQAEFLGNISQMEYAYAANLNPPPSNSEGIRRQYGLAILSEYPILGFYHHFLTSDSEQRGLLEATIEVNKTQYHFFNAHLGLKEEERKIQIQEVLEITSRYKGTKIIVGDFNAPPGSVVQIMTEQFNDVFSDLDQVFTFPSVNPLSRIDYIFVSKDIKSVNAKVEESLASDHLSISVETFL